MNKTDVDTKVIRARNSNVYHIPGPLYIAKGEMLCGHKLSTTTGFISSRNSIPPNRSMCEDCEYQWNLIHEMIG